MGVLQRRLQAGVNAVYYPIDWLPFVKRAYIEPGGVVLVEAGFGEFILGSRDAFGADDSGQRAAFGAVVPWVSTVWVALPPIVSVPVRGGRASRGGCAPIGIIGHTAEVISVTGNLKFDGAPGGISSGCDARGILHQLNVPAAAPVLVAGSTFEGEELLMAELLPRWRAVAPDLFLVIVPRHFERGAAVQTVAISRMESGPPNRADKAPSQPDVLLVDSTGELTAFYEMATLVFG